MFFVCFFLFPRKCWLFLMYLSAVNLLSLYFYFLCFYWHIMRILKFSNNILIIIYTRIVSSLEFEKFHNICSETFVFMWNYMKNFFINLRIYSNGKTIKNILFDRNQELYWEIQLNIFYVTVSCICITW